MKKFFEYIGLLSLVCFSFFLTDKTASVVQEVDNLMVQIKSHQEEYNQKGENATVKEKYIVPGLPNRSVNTLKSYQEMKKVGVYDSNYFVYDIKKPSDNLDNHLDKYIVSGNPKKRMVSIIFLVREGPIKSILDKIGDKKVSFVIPNYNFQNQISDIELAIDEGNEFLIEDYKEQNYLNTKQKLETLKNPTKICYNIEQNDNYLSLCKKNKYYSVTTTRVITKTPLTTTKEILAPGLFLTFEVNNQLLEELPNIISYIESRGYQIKPLSEHIKED